MSGLRNRDEAVNAAIAAGQAVARRLGGRFLAATADTSTGALQGRWRVEVTRDGKRATLDGTVG